MEKYGLLLNMWENGNRGEIIWVIWSQSLSILSKWIEIPYHMKYYEEKSKVQVWHQHDKSLTPGKKLGFQHNFSQHGEKKTCLQSEKSFLNN